MKKLLGAWLAVLALGLWVAGCAPRPRFERVVVGTRADGRPVERCRDRKTGQFAPCPR